MVDQDETSRSYVRGYREGLFEAWEELVKLAGRGYTARELQIMIKSSQSSLSQKVERKMAEIERTLGRKIFSKEREERLDRPSELSPGMSICFREERPDRGPQLVRKLIQEGSSALLISRLHPDQLRDRFGIEGRMIWLTKSELPDSGSGADGKMDFVSPTNLPVLAEIFKSFLDANERAVIFLEGLEYLCTQNDFRSVLKFVQLINEQVVLRKGFLVLSVNPSTMDPREFSLIEREMSQGL